MKSSFDWSAGIVAPGCAVAETRSKYALSSDEAKGKFTHAGRIAMPAAATRMDK
jgi:hypothetical protein